MRTISEIVEAVHERQRVTQEELCLALLCLYYDGIMAAPADYEGANELKLRMRAKENFERRFRMLRAEPDKYLGARWTPGTEENAEGRRLSRAVLRRAGALRDKEQP